MQDDADAKFPPPELEVGALVRLKSGGPVMVVIARDDANVTCLYYARKAERHRKLEAPLRAVAAAGGGDDPFADLWDEAELEDLYGDQDEDLQ